MKRTYDDLKRRSHQRVAEKLERVIAAYDGTARNAREILRALTAAIDFEIDVTPLVRELGKRSRDVHGAHQKHGKLAS